CMSWVIYCFFFSSRRRHTRCYRDWSSDVCSSDLTIAKRLHAVRNTGVEKTTRRKPEGEPTGKLEPGTVCEVSTTPFGVLFATPRSEERRVGKECRSLGRAYA